MRAYTEDGKTTADIEIHEDNTARIIIDCVDDEYPTYFEIENAKKFVSDLKALSDLMEEGSSKKGLTYD